MVSLAFCSNSGMDISDIWDAHLRAIVDEMAPGDARVRGLKRPAFKEIAARTRKSVEYVYQVYSGIKRVGPDFASALDREFAHGRPAGWINVAPQQDQGASDEPPKLDHSEKTEGLGLNEFLNYLNSLYPQAALSPEEVIEEAEAYREYASKRVANRILKQKFQAPGPVPDARVEEAFAAAQLRKQRQSPTPEQQLVDNPMRPARRRPGDKKVGS
jgi:hypothetical protein